MTLRTLFLAVLAAYSANGLANVVPPTLGDFGGAGLMQTPSARMLPAGSVAIGTSKVEPYGRLAMTLQPFDWLEAVYRYTSVSTVKYEADPTGKQSNKDKSFDLKVRLNEESRHLPEISVGLRDIGGTGLFSGEYIVANKRWNDLDFSLGLGWGYMGKRGDIENPLGWIYSGFRNRPSSGGDQGGKVALTSFFRGPTALFAGVQWQTPWKPLILKLEYEGNNYKNETGGPTVKQDRPFNIGLTYRHSDYLAFNIGWERGNTLLFGINFTGDFSPRRGVPRKVSDPAPVPVRPDNSRPAIANDWPEIVRQIEDNAGIKVQKIARRNRELVVKGEHKRYLYTAAALGRTARIIDAQAAADIDWITLSETHSGVPVVETSIKRDTFRKTLQQDASLGDLRRTVEQVNALPRREEELFAKKEGVEFDWGFAPGYNQNLGGPDAFVLYQLTANLDAQLRLSENTWIDGLMSFNLYNNFDKFTYTAPSNLPRVRTYLREYMISSDVIMPRLQLNHVKRMNSDWYAMAYGGFLESMYAGVGGEILYRPLNSNLALGFNLNWVKQRGFKQDFALRDYSVVTGHASAYFRNIMPTVAPGMNLTLSAGRYLAKDLGVTFDVSKEFDNGVRMGAWATFTNVSAEQFGEGSFDKGFYISLPFDLMTTSSTRRWANIVLQPLTRDGGARLNRGPTLYEITEGRNVDFFHKNFSSILQ
jgi:hypothetical protein